MFSWEVDTKDFRDLVHDNDYPNACSETNEYRFGEKVRQGDPSRRRQAEHKSGAHQQRQIV